MTQPTFQELLTSQEARDRASQFRPVEGNGTHWMTPNGSIWCCKDGSGTFTDPTRLAIWQGYLQEAAPPPEPMVFKLVEYANVYDDGIMSARHPSRQAADVARRPDYRDRLACVRVEITAIEGQFDD